MGFALKLREKKDKKENDKEEKLDGMVGEAGFGITHGYSNLSETVKNIHEYKKKGKKKR